MKAESLRQFVSSHKKIVSLSILMGCVVVVGALASFNFEFSTPYTAELKYVEQSSFKGVQGSVIPASCPSDTHYAGECDVPPPPTNPSASCISNTATMTWTEPANTTYSALRLHDAAYSWTGQCGSDGVPGNWCWDTNPPKTLGGLYGNYNWWVHACNANGCNSTTVGGSFVCQNPVWVAYCTGEYDPNGNKWQWWEKTTNTNPVEYRYLRPGDGTCVAPPICVITRYTTHNPCNPWEVGTGRDYYTDVDSCNPNAAVWIESSNGCTPLGAVQGFKVNKGRQLDYTSQTITVQASSTSGTNPYFITNRVPGTHTVTTTVPPGHVASYCVSGCGGGESGVYTPGSTASVTVPPGGAANLWWMYRLPNIIPSGYFDKANCSTIDGWAYDPDSPVSSLTVKVYEGATLLFSGLADNYRADVNTVMGITGNHGFSFYTPTSLKDGASHTLTVRAADSTTADTGLLIGTHTINCPLATPPGPVPTVNLTAKIRGVATSTWSSSVNIAPGQHIDLRWESTDATSCRGDANFSTGVGGVPSDGPPNGQTPNNDSAVGGEPSIAGGTQTYRVECRNGTGAWVPDTVLVSAASVGPAIPPPTLTVDKTAVQKYGDVGVTATFDFGALGKHTACKIVGAQIDKGNSDMLLDGVDSKSNMVSGIPFKTGPIVGKTTFTLTCSGGTDSKTVEVKPMFSEE